MSLLTKLAERAVDWALAKLFGPPEPGAPKETLEQQRGRRVMSERQRAASHGPFGKRCQECGAVHDPLRACYEPLSEPTSPRAITTRHAIHPPPPRKR